MNQTTLSFIVKKRTLGLAFVLGAASFAFAQQKVSITGKVIDKQNQAIPYASVTFSNSSNKLYSDAVLTDDNGNYTIALVPGNYSISVEAIDYKKLTTSKKITAAGNLGNFIIESETSATLTPTQDIQGVTITASSKPYKVDIDKRTYDPSQDVISKGGNLEDVLSNVPSVSVDTDGTVSMRGSSNVKFLINGKPSALLGIDDGANALQSIPADQIDKIEVITNPSSKFEASGTAGILNIILKKNKKTGFNGSVSGTVGYLPQTNLNTNLSWRKGNLTWFINGGGGYRRSKNKNTNDNWYQNITETGVLEESHQKSITKNEGENYNASTGIVYDFNDRTSVNASGTVRTFDNESNGNIDYNYLYHNAGNQYDNRTSIGKSNNLAFQGDFGLDHKFDDNGQNISLSLSLQRNRSNNNSDINETSDGSFELQDITKQKTINKSLIGKADYELPIGDKSKIEAGYRLDINKNDYDNKVQEATAANPTLDYLGLYSYNADYKEIFNAFYIQFKSKIGNLGYQIGLRDEISNVKVNYLNYDGDSVNKTKNYSNLFPTVFLSYEISKDNQFLINYSKRIDRPRSFFMIPNPNYSDNQNIFDGNIDLNPSYVDSYELGYSISKSKFTINPTLYYRHQKDDMKMLVYRDDESSNVFHTKPVNLGTDDSYGLDFNFNFDATKWLKFIGSVDLFGYNTKGNYQYSALDSEGNTVTRELDFNGKGFSYRSRITSTVKFDKTLNVQFQGFFRGAQKTSSQNRKGMYGLNIGASKTIWDGNGTISFNIQDIFNSRSMRSKNYGENYIRESYMQRQPRQFAISFTYRFKQGEKIEQPKRKKDINANEAGDDEQQIPM